MKVWTTVMRIGGMAAALAAVAVAAAPVLTRAEAPAPGAPGSALKPRLDRKSTRLNSSHT